MVYDLIVIGGGPGGYLAAERAAQGGLSVLLFEENRLGGVCLNEGCIPSKALLYTAKTASHALNGAPFGLECSEATIHHPVVITRKDRIVKRLTTGVASTLRKREVGVVAEKAMLDGKQGDVFSVSAGGRLYQAARVLLATGSAPAIPPIPGLAAAVEAGIALTSREMLALDEVPATLGVLGGGIIGLELASYYRAAGSEVTIVEQLPHLAASMDQDISAALKKEFEKSGIRLLLSTTATGMDDSTLHYHSAEGDGTLLAEKWLVATGRRPNNHGIGLENLGLAPEAVFSTNSHCETSVPGLYAVGDLNGRSMLAHTAYREAEVAVNHMLGRADAMDYSAIAACLYTDPEAAGVGETSQSAAEKGLDVDIRILPMNYSGRYMAETDRGNGFCKMLVDRQKNTVVGVHLLGGAATEIIYAASLMVQWQLPIEQLQKTVFPHPTVGEILREALFSY